MKVNVLVATAVLALTNLGCISTVRAQNATVAPRASTLKREPIITDRPDFTESPQVVPREFKAQIEAGYTFARESDEKEHAIGEVLVRVPVAKRFELRIGVPSYVIQRSAAAASGERAAGFEDAFIGGKLAIADADEQGRTTKPAIAVLFGTRLPTGARALREDDVQPEVVLALSSELAERAAISSNIGYARASDAKVNFNQFFASISLGVDVSARVGVFVEAYGFTRVESSTRRSARYANSGATFLINDDFQLDARAGIGLGNNAKPDRFFGFGFARRF